MPGGAAVDVELPVLHWDYLWGSNTAMVLYQFPTMALGGERMGERSCLNWVVRGWGVAAPAPRAQITVSHHTLAVWLYTDPRASIGKTVLGTISHSL